MLNIDNANAHLALNCRYTQFGILDTCQCRWSKQYFARAFNNHILKLRTKKFKSQKKPLTMLKSKLLETKMYMYVHVCTCTQEVSSCVKMNEELLRYYRVLNKKMWLQIAGLLEDSFGLLCAAQDMNLWKMQHLFVAFIFLSVFPLQIHIFRSVPLPSRYSWLYGPKRSLQTDDGYIWVRILNDVQLAIFRPWALLLHLVRPQLLRNHFFWCRRKRVQTGLSGNIYFIYLYSFLYITRASKCKKMTKSECFYTFSFFRNRPVNFQATLLILSNYSVNVVWSWACIIKKLEVLEQISGHKVQLKSKSHKKKNVR